MKPIDQVRNDRLSRAEQLRLAKRAQRVREREAGLTFVRLKLPLGVAKRLSFAARQQDFKTALNGFLKTEAIEIANYPQLKLLCWNRRAEFVSAREAWDLYERNWRMVQQGQMDAPEQELLRELVARFGRGVMNV